MTKKTCAKCGVDKERSEFHKKKAAKDGLNSWCKPCKTAKDVERQRLKRQQMTPEELAFKKKQKKAHRAVENAVRNGTLHKPDCCSACGERKSSRELHGHHHDYDKPLDVEWICRTCHLLDHGEAQEISCEECGKKFKRQRSDDKRFCSYACWNTSRTKHEKDPCIPYSKNPRPAHPEHP